MTHSYFVIALLAGLLVLGTAVSISDYKFRRIPNQYLIYALYYWLLIYLGMLVFLPIKLVGMGLFMSLLGMAFSGVFFYVPYMLKQVGAGDVKLAMVFGFFLTFKGAILSVLVGAMMGGVWALALAWKHGGLGHLWYNIKFMLRSAYLSGFKEMGWDLKSEGVIAMPYGVALSLGAMLIALEQMWVHYQKIIAV